MRWKFGDMKDKVLEYEVFVQGFLYIIFAGFATLLDLTTFFVLTTFVGLHYLISNFISILLGITTNYVLNKRYNFNNKSRKYVQQFSLFAFIAIIGLLLSQAIIFGLVEFLYLHPVLAKFISIFIVVIWNFFGHRKLSFGLYR